MYTQYSYFANCDTVEAVKALYRSLCKTHHPDLGGGHEDMLEINRQYQNKLRSLDGYEARKDNGETFTYRYNEKTETMVAEKLAEVLKAGLPEYAEISLIGLWIWVTDTVKGDGGNKILKELKFRWHRDRECWYWRPYPYRGRRSNGSLNELAAKYGCRNFKSKDMEEGGSRTKSFNGRLAVKS